MINLDVWITFSDGSELPVGRILCSDSDNRGKIHGEFRYAADYLSDSRSFPLDPENLPLQPGIFVTDRPQGVYAVFEDSLPDDWGRRLLAQKAGLARGEQHVPGMLAALGGNGLGALSYSREGQAARDGNSIDLTELPDLVQVASRYDAGEKIERAELAALFRAGSSPGGARPKALVCKPDGSQWVAKFPSSRDRMHMVQIEASAMDLAEKAGLDVPECCLVPAGRRNVLLVRRFDISEPGGRHHMVSMQSLLKAEGWYNLGYGELFAYLKKHSYRPEKDIPMMYRHMIFNALIGNTDDHLKNFTMIYDGQGYRLSPAYDLLPDTEGRREHVLYFDYDHLHPGEERLIKFGKAMGVRKSEQIYREVKNTMEKAGEAFQKFNVPENEVRQLKSDIQKRILKK
ncbi:MAG: type II toxin-antitoxin system HipA family toxin [Desulfobacteraceae bacterium]|nr:MAG: type II toxin-antitoxin system HipA family toxin [Desulfobacteraceae bacterium]